MSNLARKIETRFRQLGFEGAVRYSAMRCLDLAHDYAFDLLHGVDTRGVTLPAIEGGQGYKGSRPRLVRELLERLPIRFDDYTFIDLGSGKGRTLLIASEYPFRRVVGVEFVPEFSAAARQNIARYPGTRRKCAHVEAVCGDVRDFEFPEGPLLVYLFNPFRDAVMESVVGNLRRSLEADPRPAFVVYLRPLCGAVLENSGFLQKAFFHRSRLIENLNYTIYRSTIAAQPIPVQAAL